VGGGQKGITFRPRRGGGDKKTIREKESNTRKEPDDEMLEGKIVLVVIVRTAEEIGAKTRRKRDLERIERRLKVRSGECRGSSGSGGMRDRREGEGEK